MECSRESPPSAVLTEMGRDGSRRLHVRRATAAGHETESVSKNATESMTPQQFGRCVPALIRNSRRDVYGQAVKGVGCPRRAPGSSRYSRPMRSCELSASALRDYITAGMNHSKWVRSRNGRPRLKQFSP